MNEEDHQSEKHQRSKFCIFLSFFISKQKIRQPFMWMKKVSVPKVTKKNFHFMKKNY